MNDLELPVEIRKPNAVLVTRARSSQAIDLDPGQYYVTTRFPAGQQITRPVDLTMNSEELLLQPDPEDEWDHEWDEERHFLDLARPAKGVGLTQWMGGAGDPHLASKTLESADVQLTAAPGVGVPVALAERRAYLRVLSGNLLQAQCQIERADVVLKPEQREPGRIVYYRVQSPGLTVVQLLEAGAPALNMVVPPDARLAVSRRPASEERTSGLFKVEAFTKNSTANLLLRYSRQGAYQRAGIAAQSERVLSEKIEDPVAAAIGAYSLLRIGDLERLHDWTANLYQWFPWLPDGAALRGEHLARLGLHAQALNALADLPARGLPVVADGLVYAVERLNIYSRLKPERAEGLDVALAETIVEKLERFAGYVHRQRPLTSFPGLDPARPDYQPLVAGQSVLGAVGQQWLDAPAPAASVSS
jgi:hypothetical protein